MFLVVIIINLIRFAVDNFTRLEVQCVGQSLIIIIYDSPGCLVRQAFIGFISEANYS